MKEIFTNKDKNNAKSLFSISDLQNNFHQYLNHLVPLHQNHPFGNHPIQKKEKYHSFPKPDYL